MLSRSFSIDKMFKSNTESRNICTSAQSIYPDTMWAVEQSEENMCHTNTDTLHEACVQVSISVIGGRETC